MRFLRAKEKLTDAVYRLAVGEGDVRSRLRRAYLPLRRLSAQDLPEKLQEEWRSILRELTRFGPEMGANSEVWKTAIEHTTSRIRNHTGRKIAERIYWLKSQVD